GFRDLVVRPVAILDWREAPALQGDPPCTQLDEPALQIGVSTSTAPAPPLALGRSVPGTALPHHPPLRSSRRSPPRSPASNHRSRSAFVSSAGSPPRLKAPLSPSTCAARPIVRPRDGNKSLGVRLARGKA